MRFGIIGSDHGHVFTFVSHMLEAGGELVGIAADGQENSKKLLDRYQTKLFASAEELLAAGVDVVGCFAPNYRRIDIVEKCAAHRVHVMSDKPLVVNETDYGRLVKAADSGIEIGLMYTVRFEKSVRMLKAVLDSGEIGSLISMEIFNPHKLTPEKRPDWHFSKSESGGIAIDLFSHSADVFRWFTGRKKIIERSAVMVKSVLPERPEFYDFACANVTAENGVCGYFRVDWHIPDTHWSWGDLRIFCLGTKGYAEARVVGDPVSRKEELIVFSPEHGTESRRLEEDGGINETSDFLRRIRGETACITREDVLASCRETLLLDQAAQRRNLFAAEGGAR